MSQGGSQCSKSKSKGASTKVVKTKERATKHINEQLAILRAAIFDDNGKDRDVTAGMAAFKTYARNGVDCLVEFTTQLDARTLEWCFGECKRDMEALYDDAGYGWDDEEKRRELTEEGGRFLIVRFSGEDKTEAKGLVAFVHFRFTVQGDVVDQMKGDAVLCVHDVHVRESHRRKGLGKHLLTMLELVARKTAMTALTVPVMIVDDGTAAFLAATKRGFAVDDDLEDLVNFDPDCEGFHVFAKKFPSTVAKAAHPEPVPTAVQEAAVAETPAAKRAVAAAAEGLPDEAAEEQTPATLKLPEGHDQDHSPNCVANLDAALGAIDAA